MRKLQIRKLIYHFIGIAASASGILLVFISIKLSQGMVSYILDILIVFLLLLILIHRNIKTKKIAEDINYMEWITDGSVDNCSKLSVGIISLEDLVKLAVDLNSRVIHDARLGKYFVLTENMTYIHDPGLASTMEYKHQLGTLLIERGMLMPKQLEAGLYEQKRIGCKLGESLMSLGFIDETILFSTLAVQHNISFYELNMDINVLDTSWLEFLNINKAKALQVLPIGKRPDGRQVIACGGIIKPGIVMALSEAFAAEIYMVAAIPSRIYEILDKLEERERKANRSPNAEPALNEPDRLSGKEKIQFMSDFSSGRLNSNLLAKAAGMTIPVNIGRAQEFYGSSLSAEGRTEGQMISLIKSLERLAGMQNNREGHQTRWFDLLDLLKEAGYLTEEAMGWIRKESKETNTPVRQLMKMNYLVSEDTAENAEHILNILDLLLKKD